MLIVEGVISRVISAQPLTTSLGAAAVDRTKALWKRCGGNEDAVERAVEWCSSGTCPGTLSGALLISTPLSKLDPEFPPSITGRPC